MNETNKLKSISNKVNQSLFLAFIALLFSGYQFWFNYVRESRELNAIIVNYGQDSEADLFKVDIAFINNGTREETIIGANIFTNIESELKDHG